MKIELQRPNNPRVSIIISSSIRTDLLYRCLRSLVRFGPREFPYETIVVLNEVDANTEAQFRATVSGVEVTCSPVNLGFAGAVNRGRSMSRGEFLLLLHDDVEVLPGWMEALLETADSHPEAGAVGGMVLFPDGRLQGVGWILWRNGLTSPPWVGDAPEPSTFNRLQVVDYCGSASLLLRTSAWDAIGGLDEQFYPAYFVDVDLCMSLRRVGYTVLCQPKSQIYHHGGASSSPSFRNFIAEKNHKRFIQKWAETLEQQEPFENNCPAAIERALARTQAIAEKCRTRGNTTTPSTDLRPLDPAVQDREHYAKSLALQKAYIEHLGNVIDEVEANRGALLEQIAALSRQLHELEQAHGSLLRSRIWRMTAPLRYVAKSIKTYC